MISEKNKIPVTIITGFLGCGKTTFINQLIKKHNTTYFAIVENEFGEISIDSALLSVDKRQIYDLANGCICCSNNAQFVDLLDNYLNTFKKFDHLLIETTGVAEPERIIYSLLNHYGFLLNFSLQNVICLVDAKNFIPLKDKFPQHTNQIAYAEKIVINKKDLATDREISLIKVQLTETNPLATIFEAQNGQVHAELLTDNSQNLTSAFANKKTSHLKIRPVHEIQSVTININDEINTEKLFLSLKKIISENDNILRIKGIIKNENQQILLVQSVMNQLLVSSLNKEDISNYMGFLVFIGKSISKMNILEALKIQLNE